MENTVETALGVEDVIWVDVLAPGVRGNGQWVVSMATERGNEEVRRYEWKFPRIMEVAVSKLGSMPEAQVSAIMRMVRPLFKIPELRWFGLESPKISGGGWVLRIYLEGKIWVIPIPEELP